MEEGVVVVDVSFAAMIPPDTAQGVLRCPRGEEAEEEKEAAAAADDRTTDKAVSLTGWSTDAAANGKEDEEREERIVGPRGRAREDRPPADGKPAVHEIRRRHIRPL